MAVDCEQSLSSPNLARLASWRILHNLFISTRA